MRGRTGGCGGSGGSDRLDPLLVTGEELGLGVAVPGPGEESGEVRDESVRGGVEGELGEAWVVADLGERREPGRPRYGVVPWGDPVARPVTRVELRGPGGVLGWRSVMDGRHGEPARVSEGLPMTFAEASECARAMNELVLGVMEG